MQARREALIHEAAMSTVTSLDLSDCRLTDDECIYLSTLLMSNTTLKTLDLSSNHIGDAGAIEIAKLLLVNSSLQALDMHWNDIGRKGLIAIAGSLHVNKTLNSLELGRNSMTPDAVKSFIEMLKSNTGLNELGLRESKFDDEDAMALSDVLCTKNHSLKKIDLQSTMIRSLGAIALSFVENVEISLKYNKIGQTGNTCLFTTNPIKKATIQRRIKPTVPSLMTHCIFAINLNDMLIQEAKNTLHQDLIDDIEKMKLDYDEIEISEMRQNNFNSNLMKKQVSACMSLSLPLEIVMKTFSFLTENKDLAAICQVSAFFYIKNWKILKDKFDEQDCITVLVNTPFEKLKFQTRKSYTTEKFFDLLWNQTLRNQTKNSESGNKRVVMKTSAGTLKSLSVHQTLKQGGVQNESIIYIKNM